MQGYSVLSVQRGQEGDGSDVNDWSGYQGNWSADSGDVKPAYGLQGCVQRQVHGQAYCRFCGVQVIVYICLFIVVFVYVVNVLIIMLIKSTNFLSA